MAVVFIDSFDYFGVDLSQKWSAVAIGDPNADFGANFIVADVTCLAIGGIGNTVRKDLAGAPSMIVGTRLSYSAAPPDGSNWWLRFLGADAPQLALTVSPDGAIQAWRQSAVDGSADILVGSSAAGVLQAGVFSYVEVKAVISAGAAGAIEVRVEGITVLAVNGARTNATGSSVERITGVQLGNTTGSAGATYFYDLYICDTSGSANNDFLGPVQVQRASTLHDGTYRQFIPKTGVFHYLQVNGTFPTGYVSSGVVGARDTYRFDYGSNETGAAICAVQLMELSLTDTIGTRKLGHMAKSGISEQVVGAFALSTTAAYHTTIHETDPATGQAWTAGGVGAAEFGIVVVA